MITEFLILECSNLLFAVSVMFDVSISGDGKGNAFESSFEYFKGYVTLWGRATIFVVLVSPTLRGHLILECTYLETID